MYTCKCCGLSTSGDLPDSWVETSSGVFCSRACLLTELSDLLECAAKLKIKIPFQEDNIILNG